VKNGKAEGKKNQREIGWDEPWEGVEKTEGGERCLTSAASATVKKGKMKEKKRNIVKSGPGQQCTKLWLGEGRGVSCPAEEGKTGGTPGEKTGSGNQKPT